MRFAQVVSDFANSSSGSVDGKRLHSLSCFACVSCSHVIEWRQVDPISIPGARVLAFVPVYAPVGEECIEFSGFLSRSVPVLRIYGLELPYLLLSCLL